MSYEFEGSFKIKVSASGDPQSPNIETEFDNIPSWIESDLIERAVENYEEAEEWRNVPAEFS